MNKRYLLEQCNRLRAVYRDENILHDYYNDTDWLTHNKGHEALMDELIIYISSAKPIHKSYLRKWLNRKIKNAHKITKALDIKYHYFKNDEEMNPEDRYNYSFNDGIICISLTLLNVLAKRRYFDKTSYTPTDWKAIGLLK